MTTWKKISLITTIIGLVDSIYLTVLKYSNNKALCIEGVGDCWSVNISPYSEIWGIPVAVFGAGAYLAILALLVLESRQPTIRRFFPYLFFGITLCGTIYSAYLTYLEIAVIKAICPFCVISAITMLILFILSLHRLSNPAANN